MQILQKNSRAGILKFAFPGVMKGPVLLAVTLRFVYGQADQSFNATVFQFSHHNECSSITIITTTTTTFTIIVVVITTTTTIMMFRFLTQAAA